LYDEEEADETEEEDERDYKNTCTNSLIEMRKSFGQSDKNSKKKKKIIRILD